MYKGKRERGREGERELTKDGKMKKKKFLSTVGEEGYSRDKKRSRYLIH